MFRRSHTALSSKFQNGFAIFAKQAWKLPKVHEASSFRAKSRIVHAAWAKLTPAAKAKFSQIGKRTPVPKKASKPLGPWKSFVKKNYSKVRRLPFNKRLPTLAKQWSS